MTPSLPSEAVVSDIPFSSNQEFTFMFEEGEEDGQFGPRNHLVHGWRIQGQIDVDVLRSALDDLVARHEMLRTSIVLGEARRYQEVLPTRSPELDVRDLPCAPSVRDERAEELLIEIESGTLEIDVIPHIRVVLGRFDLDDNVLVIQVHHALVDGWSMRVLIRDLAALYAAWAAGGSSPPSPRPYREYAQEQQEYLAREDVEEARDYWRRKLRGAEVTALPTDRPASYVAAKRTSVHRHLVTSDVLDGVWSLTRATKTTPFMVCLAALQLTFSRITERTDMVIPTFTPGRDDGRFDETVGTFFNFLPLRTEIKGCATFREVLLRTRSTCVESYVNDIPFVQILQEAPDLMNSAMDEYRAICVFQFFPFPYVFDGEVLGDLRLSEIRRRLVSQPVGCDVPDGILWTLNLNPEGDLIGHLQFRRNRFDETTADLLEKTFSEILARGVTDPDSTLR